MRVAAAPEQKGRVRLALRPGPAAHTAAKRRRQEPSLRSPGEAPLTSLPAPGSRFAFPPGGGGGGGELSRNPATLEGGCLALTWNRRSTPSRAPAQRVPAARRRDVSASPGSPGAACGSTPRRTPAPRKASSTDHPPTHRVFTVDGVVEFGAFGLEEKHLYDKNGKDLVHRRNHNPHPRLLPGLKDALKAVSA